MMSKIEVQVNEIVGKISEGSKPSIRRFELQLESGTGNRRVGSTANLFWQPNRIKSQPDASVTVGHEIASDEVIAILNAAFAQIVELAREGVGALVSVIVLFFSEIDFSVELFLTEREFSRVDDLESSNDSGVTVRYRGVL